MSFYRKLGYSGKQFPHATHAGQRVVSLPDSVVGRALDGVRLAKGVLEISFAPVQRTGG